MLHEHSKKFFLCLDTYFASLYYYPVLHEHSKKGVAAPPSPHLGETLVLCVFMTHFVCMCIAGKASRTEKFLGACAAGKWVLHKSYMEACRAERRFIEVRCSHVT